MYDFFVVCIFFVICILNIFKCINISMLAWCLRHLQFLCRRYTRIVLHVITLLSVTSEYSKKIVNHGNCFLYQIVILIKYQKLVFVKNC